MNEAAADKLLIAIANGDPLTSDDIFASGIDINGFGICVPRTVLMAAAYAGRSDLIRALVGRGADLELGHADWGTALHQAAGEGHVDAVRTLCGLGGNIEAETAAGITPLMVAAAWGHPEVVKTLLENGASVDHRDRSGSTAYMIAIEKDQGNIAAILEAARSADP